MIYFGTAIKNAFAIFSTWARRTVRDRFFFISVYKRMPGKYSRRRNRGNRRFSSKKKSKKTKKIRGGVTRSDERRKTA